ncbi:hypothetical protein [Leeuwenhoekiella marinoflava]|uniref:hypothetical protein n=1 Tax=Leeuwenhoekiella marinoflava TaxID=988 RepID=UPI0030022D0C
MVNSYDYEVLSKIQEYRTILNSEFFLSFQDYEIATVVLDASEISYNTLEDIYNEAEAEKKNDSRANQKGFWDCLRKTGGKKIARGIAWGAISGAVYGAARGAIVGGIGGALWSAADCLGSIEAQHNYVMRIDDFLDENPITFSSDIISLDDDVDILFVEN